MDHCFPKKGLTLSSRQHALFAQNNSSTIPQRLPQKVQIQFNRALPQNVSLFPQGIYGSPLPHQTQPVGHPNHQRTLSVNLPNSLPQTHTLNSDSNLNQMLHNRQIPQQLNNPNENSQFKFFTFQQMQQNMKTAEIEVQDEQNRRVGGVQQIRPLAELKILPQNLDSSRYEIKSPSNKISFDKARVSSPREEFILKPVKSNNDGAKNEKEAYLLNNTNQIVQKNEQLEAQQQKLEEKIVKLEKQNKQLEKQIKNREIKNHSIEESKKQIENLLKLLGEKDGRVKQIEQICQKRQLEYVAKINTFQQQIRLLKGNKNRLQIEVKNNQKLFKSQRQKNQKTRQQIDKLIFFQQDLIHAKDYNKLKQQIEYIALENSKMFQQHQKFIHEAKQYRRKAEEGISELQRQIKAIRVQNEKFQDRINALTQCGDDKLLNIKLQNDLNFLTKKIQQQKITIAEQQSQLKQSFQLRAAQQKESKQNKKSQSILDQINIRQIQDTISLYEARLSDMSQQLAKKQAENTSQKRTLDLLTTQLRRSREEKHINAMKEKSNQNNVKNLKGEVEVVEKTYQIQLEIKNKKIWNLEQSVQRKSREIVEKDKFIKQFLLSRLKGLENSSLQSISILLRQYFQPIASENAASCTAA